MTSAAALRAAADKLTPFYLTNYSNKLTTKQPTPPYQESAYMKTCSGENGLCADPLAKARFLPPPAVLHFVAHFVFRLRISLFREAQCSTVPRTSQRSQNCRVKLLYSLFVTVPLRSCFLFYTHYLRHIYAPIFLFPVDLRKVTCSELFIYRPVLPPPLARKRQNLSHGEKNL